jgi:UDP-GlcNAc3NAcA epimerase
MSKHKIASIVGARPQFIKAAAVSRAFATGFGDRVQEILIHSGQHYDDNMSKVFFDEMEIPKPAYDLGVGSGTHGSMLAAIISKTEEVLLREKPEILIVYGDTNTTLGGALAAAKLNIPVAHVEAGLRSFNKSMPEEVNRVLTDHISTLLFSPTETGVNNLVREGFSRDNRAPWSADNPKVFHCGDVMYDTALYFLPKAERSSDILNKLHLEGRDFALCTIHRNNNTDEPERLSAILGSLDEISKKYGLPVVFPVHPRTSKMMAAMTDQSLLSRLDSNPFFIRIAPVGYFDMLILESRSRIILTDSGGVQKESYFFKKPCVVLRAETEWTELVVHKTALLANADKDLILNSFRDLYKDPPRDYPPIFGDGEAAAFICREIVSL